MALTDTQGNMRNIIDIYSDVAEKMKELGELEQASVLTGLGGTYHKQRLLVLLDDLGKTDSMYRSMYETSVNSAGSAMIENEKHMQSLQARINLMKVEFEKLAVTIGDAFLSDGMIEFMKLSTSLLSGLSNMVNAVGVLPPLFFAASFAVLSLSNRAKDLTSAINAKAKAMYTSANSIQAQTNAMVAANGHSVQYNRATVNAISSTERLTKTTNSSAVATRSLSMSKANVTKYSAQMATQMNITRTSLSATTKATQALAVAGRTLGSAFIWTIPFVVLGVLIEQLTKASGKTRELKESAQSTNREMMTSFKSSQDEIEKLSSKYSELEKVINSGNYDNKTLAEYHDIQNKLANLMPTLITGEDEYGNKLIESSDAVQVKVDMLKQQLAIEKEIAQWQATKDRDERIGGNEALVGDNTKALETELKKIQNLLDTTGIDVKINNIDDVTKALESIAEARKIAVESGQSNLIKMYDNLAKKIIESQQAANGFSLEIKSAQGMLKTDYFPKLSQSLKDNEKVWGSTTEAVSEFMGELLKLSDVDSVVDLNTALTSISLNGSAKEEIQALVRNFEALNKSTYDNFPQIASKVEESMGKIGLVLKGSGLSDSKINVVLTVLSSKLDTVRSNFDKVESEMKRTGGTYDEVSAALALVSDEQDKLSDSIDDTAQSFDNLKSSISYINGILEDYQENNKLSASTILEIVDKYEDLLPYINDEAKLIQELTKIRDEDINAARQQLSEKLEMNSDYYKQNVGMLESYMKEHFSFYNEDLEKFSTLAELKADVEKKLIEHLSKQWGAYYDAQSKTFIPKVGASIKENQPHHLPDGDVSNYSAEIEQFQKDANDANRAYQEAAKAFAGLKFDDFSLDFTKIGTSADKEITKAKKETKESIYLSDKFKQSLEAVNLEIEKQQSIQKKHPEHSEAYRKSIEAQLKLEREKLKLIQDQADALDKQIKSGKIAQTGNVTIGDGNSKSSTTKSSKLSGWGNITSGYGAKESFRKSSHTGIDLASKKGTRLDSNVSGKVDVVGFNDISGNFVKITDSKGFKHFYGHLEKAFVVAGDTIEKGMQIGTIGNTGNVVAGKGGDGSHLHYEIKDSSGKQINPTEYAKAAQSMVVSSEKISTVVSNTAQSIDDAKSTLIGLQSDALKSEDFIAELELSYINAIKAGFEHKRSGYDEILAFEEAKLKNVTVGTTQYNKTKEKQITILKAKQKVNNDELAYVEGLIKSGNLSAITLEQMKSRTMELKTAIENLNAELGNLALDKIMDFHDSYTQKQDNTIDYEKNKLAELDKNSSRYAATLEKLNTHTQRKITTHQETIKSIENEIKVLGLQGEALQRAKDTIQSLTLEMQNFKQEMSDNNYEIIVNIKTRYDEEIDDINFEIERSKAIQALYKEGSADAANEIKKQIAWQEKLVQSHDASRKALQAELNSRDILPERIKEITELMEDETVAYWNAKRAVEELNESLEETRKKLLNDIADKFISAYKNVIGEMRDMKLDAIDDEIEAEEKAHDKRMKQLQDEMDLFRKNAEEMLRLIDQQEAERSFNMEIDEMTEERDKLVDQINLLSMDDGHEAKSKRKKLLEQLAKLDKDIEEKYHQRDIELQKEDIERQIREKEDEIELTEESLEEQNNAELNSLREKRKYWEQYFRDLENDQRKFNQIREDLLNGHFDKVVSEFDGYMAQMIATMPELENTLNGTMQSVGTAIRQNVIDEIKNAIDALREFQNMQIATNSIVDDFNPNASKDASYQGNTGTKPSTTSPTESNSSSNSSNKGQVYASLNRGDLQVLFGKFISDVVAPTFKAETKERIALKSEGLRLGQLGRSNSSQIPVNSAFGNEIGNLTSSQIEQLKSFIKSNSGSILGGNYTSAFTNGLASLHTGGMTKYNGTGNDGIGGKLAMLHPNEIVLNPLQSEEMLKSSSILQNIMKMITPVLNKFPTPSSITNNTSQPNIEINLNGAIHNSNGRTAKDLISDIANEMRTRGMWK